MGKRIGEKAWTPEIIKYMQQARASGLCFDQIGSGVYEKFGLAVSGRTVAIKLRSLGLIAPPSGGPRYRKPYKKPAPPPVMRTANTCSEIQCRRQRADGYALCLSHLPPLNLGGAVR